MFGGCSTTVFVNQADRDPAYQKETGFASERNSEMTYRRIYTMLYKCTSGYYRVQGDYNPESHHGEISVDTGVGFQNDLYFADSRVMHISVEADGADKSNVHIKHTNSRGSPYGQAMAVWVNEGSDDCAARSSGGG